MVAWIAIIIYLFINSFIGNKAIIVPSERADYMAEYVNNNHEEKIKNLENSLKEIKKRLEDMEKDSGIRIKYVN